MRHGGKLEYLYAVERLLRNAFAEERYDEACKLIEYLRQTRLPEIDPLSFFKMELELLSHENTHDIKALRVFQNRRLSNKVRILPGALYDLGNSCPRGDD